MNPDDQSVLDAAGLGGRKALVRDAAGGGTALVVDVSRDEMLDRWAAARDAVDRTGRWPVLCMRHEAHDGSLFSRFYFDEGADGADSDPAAVLARAETIDVDARLAELVRAQFGNDDLEWTVDSRDRSPSPTTATPRPPRRSGPPSPATNLSGWPWNGTCSIGNAPASPCGTRQ